MSKTFTLISIPFIFSAGALFGQGDFEFVDNNDHVKFQKPKLLGACENLVEKVYADKQMFSIVFRKNWEVTREHDAIENSTFDTCRVSIEAKADPGYSFRWVKTKFFGAYKLAEGHTGEIIVDGLVGTNEIESFKNFKEVSKNGIISARLLGFPVLFKEGSETHFPCGAEFGNQLFYTLKISGDTKPKFKASTLSLHSITGQGSAAAIEIPFDVFTCN